MIAPEKILVREKDAATFLGVEQKTVQDWRFHNVGPPYIKYANDGGRRGAVRYDMADLIRFIEARTVQPGNAA